jgi:hypothetical protein
MMVTLTTQIWGRTSLTVLKLMLPEKSSFFVVLAANAFFGRGPGTARFGFAIRAPVDREG